MPPSILQNPLPEALSGLISGYQARQIFTGLSTSQVFRLEKPGRKNLYLKISACGFEEDLYQEQLRLSWLKEKLPVPELLLFAADDFYQYLLISEIEGSGAHEISSKNEILKVIEELAAGLRMIHELPIGDCPFASGLEKKIERAQERVDRGLADACDFGPERKNMTAGDVFRELIEIIPETEDPVFTHGDYCLPNIILNDGKLNGFIDLAEAAVSDRYQDIALLTRSLEYNFGAEWRPLLFETLGVKPDPEKLRFYTLLDAFF